eukprot:TRINITY_DN4250_c0_g1_i1.p1 TRINITY_DN4250_c0_g1~~TRINITY_DN4250_c0_g1_i1.p1  ORF type:complete len:206 (-),score=50.69 TRINITY_DN4250_c0_g1_i1:163-780(-)
MDEIEATPDHCAFCFDVLARELETRAYGEPRTRIQTPEFPDVQCPLFVTWYKYEGGGSNLRGCIGTFSDVPVHQGLADYAKTSAFDDRRFSPIDISELSKLECGVSLLVKFEEAASVRDWEIGRHGILIKWTDEHSGQKYHATYLPEVASDQQWNHDETLRSLVKKAGFRLGSRDPLPSGIRLTRYQSSKQKMSFADYRSFRSAK